MIEALIYILYVDQTKRQIELVYDSMLTSDIAQGIKVPKKNIKIAMLLRRLFRVVESKRGRIKMTHVYSHTMESHKHINNIKFNNMNDAQQKQTLKLQKRALATNVVDRKWNACVDDLATMGLEDEVQCTMGRYEMTKDELETIRREVITRDVTKWDMLLEYEGGEVQENTSEAYANMITNIHEAATLTLPPCTPHIRRKYIPTKALMELREERTKRASTMSLEERATLNKKISKEGRKSYRQHVENLVKEIGEANRCGNSSKMYRLVRAISGKSRRVNVWPTKHDPKGAHKGKLITCITEFLNEFADFMGERFDKPSIENDMEDKTLVQEGEDGQDITFSREEFDKVVMEAKKGKATNDDNVPNEVYQLSKVARE